MDNRKIRCIKREIKVKKLSQQAAAYRQNFRTEQRKPEEETPEHYAERNIAGYGRKYANTVKAQGKNSLFSKKKKSGREKSSESKEHRQKAFPLRKALCVSLPKREQACKKTAELLHQA